MAIKTQSAKQKGRLLQQWTRDMILSTFPALEPADCTSTSMGASGEDVLMSPLARRSFNYSVECKSNAKNSVYKIMAQAQSNCPEGSTALAIVKADRQKPLAVVDAEHFFSLTKQR